MKKKIRKRRLTKEGKMFTAGAVAVIVLLALGAFFFLFRVDNVYVVGSTRYTDDQIKEYVLTTPMTSNTVLAMLFQKHTNAENIPFVDSFDLERVNAHTLRIHVNEKKIVGYIAQGTDRLYFNKDGLVVEVTPMEQEEIDALNQEEEELNQLKEQAAQEAAAQEADAALESLTGESTDTTDGTDTEDAQEEGTDSETAQADNADDQVLQAVESDSGNENATKFKAAVTDVPRVIGITDKTSGIALGDTIPAVADGIYNTILGITRMVEKYEILPEMLCFNENQEIILVYNSGKIHCNLGKDRLLEEKITRVAAILPKLTDFTGILHLEDYDTDITNIIFSKETLYTLKMEIAQIEGKDFSEETTDPGQDAATDPAADTADTEGDTVAQDAGSDPAASGEDTQDGDTQEDTAADGSDAGTTQDASGQESESAGKADGASQSGADSSGTQQTAGE